MNIEYECRLLGINKENFEKLLLEKGAVKKDDYYQKRYTYDFNPKKENKWVRLRTNGKINTLTIKEITNNKAIDGTNELEIEVSDFTKANEILNQLGYIYRNYQENKRTTYTLDGVEIDIDSWPMIPTYVEIEGKSKEDVYNIIDKLNLPKKDITYLDVTGIYNDIYNIDVLSIKELKF